ncbi:MAG: recombination protein RecR [Bacteroidales bacterium]|nr:recombination protein RecR [Bacteroidales bacterium]MBN2819036.1 recombination protein RecR [Bacteroidales bacterium]
MIKANYPSQLLAAAVEQFSGLPGIGERTALRMVLFLLKQDKETARKFPQLIGELLDKIHFCKVCHNISDTDICSICSSNARDKSTICVVENIKDVMSIENTQQFNGLYHVLGGIISPMEGIGPQDLYIDSLVKRSENSEIKEIILALSTTMEGDTTNFYIFKKLKHTGIKISVIARGVAIGNELEYTDELTLGRSILNRQPFESSI